MKYKSRLYKQNYDYSNYDIEDDAVDRGDMTWQEDAGYDELDLIQLGIEDAIQYETNVAESKYHNEYYLGNHKWGPRQITKSNEKKR